jgi:hypothetical protein
MLQWQEKPYNFLAILFLELNTPPLYPPW